MTSIQAEHVALDARIRTDGFDYRFITNLFEEQYKDQLYNPLGDSTATARLLGLRENWRTDNQTTVFTTGGFDCLHLDHTGYLLHTKLAGAATRFMAVDRNGRGPTWEELSPEEQQSWATYYLENNELRLIVSIDGDASIAKRKSGKPEKGGGNRPIHSWESRARMVANLAVPGAVLRPGESATLADAITIHGPEDAAEDSPHYNHFDLASYLQPEAWVFFGESQDIIDEAPNRRELGSVALSCINDGVGTHYFRDELLGGKISTTSITHRILGTQ